MNRFWSEEEVNYLKNNYENMTAKELGKKLDRSMKSVKGKVQHLYLNKTGNKGQFKKLPTPPKETLEELYLEKNETPSRIAEILRVSSGTVRRWLREYGIPIKRPYLSKVKFDITEEEKAYLAGLVDGDGTISACKYKSEKAKTGYGLGKEVAIISTHRHFIERLQEMIGGDIHTFIYHDSREKKEGYKLGFRNQASSLAFLSIISPYLILKKERVYKMIELLESQLNTRATQGPSAVISPYEWGLVDEIKELNAK